MPNTTDYINSYPLPTTLEYLSVGKTTNQDSIAVGVDVIFTGTKVGSLTMPTTSSFQLHANKTYELTGYIGFDADTTDEELVIGWYNQTAESYIDSTTRVARYGSSSAGISIQYGQGTASVIFTTTQETIVSLRTISNLSNTGDVTLASHVTIRELPTTSTVNVGSFPVTTDATFADATDARVSTALAIKTYIDNNVISLGKVHIRTFELANGLLPINEVSPGGPMKFRYGSNVPNVRIQGFNQSGGVTGINTRITTTSSTAVSVEDVVDVSFPSATWTNLGTTNLAVATVQTMSVSTSLGDHYLVYIHAWRNTTGAGSTITIKVEWFPPS